jgi:hypothetical protein
MVGKAEVEVIAGERLAVALGGERRTLAELIESVARSDIERSMEIDQGAVEVEKDSLEAAFQKTEHS